MKPECKISSDGTQRWYLNGVLHREGGPAVIEPEGSQSYWLNGLRHREDGPAIIYSDGYEEWYFNYVDVTDYVNAWAKERNIYLGNMSDADKMGLKVEMERWANELDD